MNPTDLYRRYQEMQAYVGWTDEDARRVQALAPLLEPHFPKIIDDFYAEIERHPQARRVITGGQPQIDRLKGTLLAWLRELFSGSYDAAYVVGRWRVGWRHVDIGLDQVYTNVALSRLRCGLLLALDQGWPGHDLAECAAARRSLNLLLDLDLAIIEDAYQTEYLARVQHSEQLARTAERQRLTLAKERSEAAFGTLVEAVPCLIVICRADLALLYFSPFAEELTGYAAEEVLGKDYGDVFLPDPAVRQSVKENVQRILAGRPTRGLEYPIGCKDGAQRWILWNAQRLDDYQGGPVVLAVGQDITSLKRAQEQALQAERLAGIGQLVTGLAHESGNALARSQACLEMLTLEVQDRPEVLDLIARVQKAQDHLRQLYDEVRGYAAPLRLEREVWNLAGVWRQAWANLAVLRQGRQAELREETGGIDLDCCVDQFRLEQVFRNILENALAACRDPVEIVVRCTETSLDGQPAVRVAVRDNGPGLGPEQRQRIFEPFYTTRTKGLGLGMAIAKRIVEAHGGRLVVGDAPKPGAELVIALPRK
jgi:PAS domain S-box-containing protein